MKRQCTICKLIAEWTNAWDWWGSIKDWDDGLPLVKCCSAKCKAEVNRIGPEKLEAELREGLSPSPSRPKRKTITKRELTKVQMQERILELESYVEEMKARAQDG